MNYTLLASLGVALALGLDLFLLRTALVLRKVFWTSYAIVFGFQLLVNGVLTGIPVVRYDPDRIVGWRIAYAPVEDLLFGFAMVLSTLVIWVWLGRRAVATSAGARPARDAMR
jgi:lycopene cyclase domain-containing protein